MKYSKVTIFGPGLMGGSVALAVQKRKLAAEIVVWEREEALLKPIKASGVATWAFTDPVKAVHDAEVVILCTPIGAMKSLAEAMRSGLDPFAVVTDIGSVKTPVVEALEPIFADAALWVGSHPMAGSQQSGFDAAQADLFEGAACVVTPTSQTDPEAERIATEFWGELGCHVIKMTPQEHDKLAAQISHMPHLSAAAVASIPEAKALTMAGRGFKDSTRIAESPAEMWVEILMVNRKEINGPLEQLIGQLQGAREALERGDEKKLREILVKANENRNLLKKP